MKYQIYHNFHTSGQSWRDLCWLQSLVEGQCALSKLTGHTTLWFHCDESVTNCIFLRSIWATSKAALGSCGVQVPLWMVAGVYDEHQPCFLNLAAGWHPGGRKWSLVDDDSWQIHSICGPWWRSNPWFQGLVAYQPVIVSLVNTAEPNLKEIHKGFDGGLVERTVGVPMGMAALSIASERPRRYFFIFV